MPIVGIVLAAVVAALFAVIGRKPNQFRITRSTTINARPETVAALIDDFRQWEAWSPWDKLDPALKRTYSGAARGQGAVYEWAGNRKAGSGRMEITARSPSLITFKLDFLKPFEAHNTTEFTLQPVGDATNVTWSMHGPNAFINKAMSVFVNMDKLVGADFEKGLASLKTLAETK